MALNDDRNKKARGLGNVSAGAPMPTQYARLIAMPDSAPSLSQAPQKPGAFARGLFDAGAVTTDIAKAPIKGLADGTNRLAIGGYNILREGVGMQPVQPRQFNYSATQDDLAAMRAENAQNPVAARPQIPAVAAPKSPTQQTPQRPSPSQRMTDNQASAAEVNARTATQSPASPPTGMGVPAGAGGAAPIRPGDPNTFTGTNGITRRVPMPGTIGAATNQSGSVQSQNFGNPVVPQAQASIAQPRVASTFGMSVNDPRINDQTAPVARPQVSLRGPDAMAEAYNSREDREARQKVLSDLDSQRFRLEMIAGNPGRRGRAALEALGQNAQQQAALAAGGEKLSADAVQGRASRNNVLANTGMEQSGQTQRQQMAGDVASQGQYLDYDAKNRATNASLIDKPQYVTDRSGNLVQVAGGKGAGVTGADGSVIKMPQTTKVDNDALSAVSKELTALINNPPEMGADATAYNNRLAELRAQQSAFLGGGQQASQKVPSPGAIDELKKNPALAAKFDEWYGQGAAARYSK